MRCWILSLTAIYGVAFGAAAAASDETGDRDSLQGKWQLVETVKKGKTQKITDQSEDFFELVFKGDKITARYKIGAEQGGYKIDPNKSIKTIDILPSTGDEKGKTLKGIYELKADQLKLCMASGGPHRPESFKAEGDKTVVYVLRRAKK
jgi:uncharacterized protein (TIGR03067 family)